MLQPRRIVTGAFIGLACSVAVAEAYPPVRSPFPMQRPGFIEERASPRRIRSVVVESAADEAVAQAVLSQGLGVVADQSGALQRSLFPRARPQIARRATSPATARAIASVPAPAQEGGRVRRALSRIFGGGQDRPERARAGGVPDAPTEIQRGICGSRALQGRRLPPITNSRNGCGIAEPVAVTAVHGIPLSIEARVDCRLARSFAEWVEGSMMPAVGRRGGGVARIRIIGDYSCRTRNSRPGARLSEHARGMALDVAGYTLNDGTQVTVLRDWRRRPHRSDLREMYGEACGIFRTTLSPEADRYHQDHFHFDLAQHRGGGNYCR